MLAGAGLTSWEVVPRFLVLVGVVGCPLVRCVAGSLNGVGVGLMSLFFFVDEVISEKRPIFAVPK